MKAGLPSALFAGQGWLLQVGPLLKMEDMAVGQKPMRSRFGWSVNSPPI